MPRRSTKINNVIEAMEVVLTSLHKSDLTATAMKKATPAINYIKERLNLTEMQTIFLSMLCDAGRPLDYCQFSGFLGCHRIRLISYDNELQELVRLGIINRLPCDHGEDDYAIRTEAMVAFQKNEAYQRPSNKDLSFDDFLVHLRLLMLKKSTGAMTYDNFIHDILELMDCNEKLDFVKTIKGYNLADEALLVLLACVYSYLEVDGSAGEMEFGHYLENKVIVKRVLNQLKQGTYCLIKEGVIESFGDVGFLSLSEYVLTTQAKQKLLKGYTFTTTEKVDPRKGLRLHEDIKQKTLYYNNVEKEQISRLADLLKEENFKGIQQRLEQKGMRKGFSCLFYGAPGTGKTETVLQLAKLTGRDIFEVNIAGLRDKFVGESEKNIKEIFTKYKQFCDNCSIAPILLFNEADAIINKRVENVEHSVDKMDNAMQNIILNELEQLEGILIATTNLTSNLDDAFERRFLYKVEFKKPTSEVKSRIWQSIIPEITASEADILSRDYDFSGGEIENVSRKLTVDHILYGKATTLKQLREYCDTEAIAKKKKNERSKVSGFGKVA